MNKKEKRNTEEKNQHINKFDFNIYNQIVFEDFNKISLYFPLLKIVRPPYSKIREITIQGFLIPRDIVDLNSGNNLKRFGFDIVAKYPFYFPMANIVVCDIYNKIKMEYIPEAHRHKYPDGTLCTHHEKDILRIVPENRTYAILDSAWNLYWQYYRIRYYKKRWTLPDLPHDEGEAIKIIKRGH